MQIFNSKHFQSVQASYEILSSILWLLIMILKFSVFWIKLVWRINALLLTPWLSFSEVMDVELHASLPQIIYFRVISLPCNIWSYIEI